VRERKGEDWRGWERNGTEGRGQDWKGKERKGITHPEIIRVSYSLM